MKTHTFALNLSAARDEVFSFLADASHLPVWTGGFHAEPRRAGACWQTTTPFGEARPIHTMPGSIPGVCDSGPASPVIEIAYVAPVRSRVESAIALATTSLTAPCSSNVFWSRPSSRAFISGA